VNGILAKQIPHLPIVTSITGRGCISTCITAITIKPWETNGI
jgi:hypothetical protein